MEKSFTIQCSMEERWFPAFMSMLWKMESNGHSGHSEIVGLYSDGDGDFRPKFRLQANNNEYLESLIKYFPTPKSTIHGNSIYDADYHIIKQEQWEEDCKIIKAKEMREKHD